MEEILEHPWFEGTDINEIKEKTIIPPFVPKLVDDADAKYYKLGQGAFSMEDTVIPREKIQEVKEMSDKFEGFDKISKFKIKNN